jgi:hypothetical protein
MLLGLPKPNIFGGRATCQNLATAPRKPGDEMRAGRWLCLGGPDPAIDAVLELHSKLESHLTLLSVKVPVERTRCRARAET